MSNKNKDKTNIKNYNEKHLSIMITETLFNELSQKVNDYNKEFCSTMEIRRTTIGEREVIEICDKQLSVFTGTFVNILGLNNLDAKSDYFFAPQLNGNISLFVI